MHGTFLLFPDLNPLAIDPRAPSAQTESGESNARRLQSMFHATDLSVTTANPLTGPVDY